MSLLVLFDEPQGWSWLKPLLTALPGLGCTLDPVPYKESVDTLLCSVCCWSRVAEQLDKVTGSHRGWACSVGRSQQRLRVLVCVMCALPVTCVCWGVPGRTHGCKGWTVTRDEDTLQPSVLRPHPEPIAEVLGLACLLTESRLLSPRVVGTVGCWVSVRWPCSCVPSCGRPPPGRWHEKTWPGAVLGHMAAWVWPLAACAFSRLLPQRSLSGGCGANPLPTPTVTHAAPPCREPTPHAHCHPCSPPPAVNPLPTPTVTHAALPLPSGLWAVVRGAGCRVWEEASQCCRLCNCPQTALGVNYQIKSPSEYVFWKDKLLVLVLKLKCQSHIFLSFWKQWSFLSWLVFTFMK